jgi:hypothetical protein
MVNELGQIIYMINCCGPYDNKKVLWDDCFSKGVISQEMFIIGGDLHFKLSSSEVWGVNERHNILVDYFKDKI